jgi:ABC-type transport system substrate-binding protein
MGGLTEEEMAGMPAYQKDRAEAMAEAQRLIQEAGAEGATLRVLAGTRTQYRNAALWYVGNWKEAGLNAVLDMPPDETARSQRQDTCQFEVIVIRSAVVPHDPNSYLTFWEEGSPDNPCDTPNTELQPLIRQQATQADPEQRRQIVEQIVDKSLESLWVINLHAGGYWYSGWPEVHFNVPNHLTGGLRHLDTWLEQ